jgi:glycosyltransferase involved in cell wall biosynthesis
MTKILILAYDFPPYVSVGGLRPYSWYRYFRDAGIEPIVVTRQWSNEHGNELDYIDAGSSDETFTEKTDFGTIIRTPYHPNLSNRLLLKHGGNKYRLLRKGTTLFYQIFQHLTFRGPKSGLYRGAKHFLKTEKVDLIIATGDPFVLFKYASKLSKRHSIPWIADYRDIWVGYDRLSFGPIDAKLVPFLERKYLKNAAFITTVSSYFECQIKKNLPRKDFYILPNGFDPEAIEIAKKVRQSSDHLTISISGTIQPWYPLEGFLATCAQFIQHNPNAKLRIKFYGTNLNTEIALLVEKKFPTLLPMVVIVPKLQNKELLQEMSKDNLLLLFNDYCKISTKIYDYIGMQRKILLCFSEDEDAVNLKQQYFNFNDLNAANNEVQSDVIEKTNAGITLRDRNHLSAVLNEMSEEFQKSGSIRCESVNIDIYSRKLHLQNFAKHIRATILLNK